MSEEKVKTFYKKSQSRIRFCMPDGSFQMVTLVFPEENDPDYHIEINTHLLEEKNATEFGKQYYGALMMLEKLKKSDQESTDNDDVIKEKSKKRKRRCYFCDDQLYMDADIGREDEYLDACEECCESKQDSE
jgi:hypothetical protein